MTTSSQAPLVITLWETYGSRMEEIAAALAERTGLPVHRQAYSSDQIEEGQARREKEGRLTARLASFIPGFASEGGDPTRTMAITEASFRDLAEANTKVVHEEATKGGILMGRNGQFILAQRPNTVHVKVDGPVGARVANAARSFGIDAERAAKRQSLEDEFRADLSQKTYRFDPRDNDYYDIVVNGATLSPKAAADVILATVRAKLGSVV